ncbi:exonuclease V subunit gamma, partial [Salmonella enterica subsp. enterica serovar Heidelberg str. SARA32]
MLRVYHSNRLDVLEALMEFIVERERLDDPFEPEMILVQSTGMAQWLQMTLSQKFGIAANIAFPLPASFIWEMFVRVFPALVTHHLCDGLRQLADGAVHASADVNVRQHRGSVLLPHFARQLHHVNTGRRHIVNVQKFTHRRA